MGKSCLLLRFADDTYTESYITTIGVDFVSSEFLADIFHADNTNTGFQIENSHCRCGWKDN